MTDQEPPDLAVARARAEEALAVQDSTTCPRCGCETEEAEQEDAAGSALCAPCFEAASVDNALAVLSLAAHVDRLTREHDEAISKIRETLEAPPDPSLGLVEHVGRLVVESEGIGKAADRACASAQRALEASDRAHAERTGALQAEVERLGRERDAARKLAGLDAPWPIRDAVRKLADAADHLLHVYGCDVLGWEEIGHARTAARRWLAWIEDGATPLTAAEALRAAAECTGLTARWCPVHGDCVCEGDNLDDARCPLHAPSSTHADTPAADPAHPHLVDGAFQSDKYPTTPRGKVPLSTKDPTAQDLLWAYAQRRRSVDEHFAADLEIALRGHGYEPTSAEGAIRAAADACEAAGCDPAAGPAGLRRVAELWDESGGDPCNAVVREALELLGTGLHFARSACLAALGAVATEAQGGGR